MITLLSPAKTLDFNSPLPTEQGTQPQFMHEAQTLVESCQSLSTADLRELMSISPQLADLTYERFANWGSQASATKARQAVLAFKGEAYEGLAASNFSEADLQFAQDHLRILSGLYGILRPLDLIEPYRLDMGIRLASGTYTNLYQFWKSKLSASLNQELAEATEPTIINLASAEYSRAVEPKKLNAAIIEPIFLDEKNGTYKVISFYAKRARGLMSRYIIEHRIEESSALKDFRDAGYSFDASMSDQHKWYFTRDENRQKR
ncbi:UPF0246 protein [Bombiscardovia apis]|uniref:UPF0246 protein KIMH_06400 n=1 Tax=Bombiscardovia apis TaxID=2932182 RepID=A0ABM8BCE7_9BIFI|nr:peroxide stress protein YaaA [Bombiscardovia apis]BDR54529.1 UPF0246 protein [Bombiscardovia apis]BDR54554.1 UPF0246 protein [Bombiscardovia apis]